MLFFSFITKSHTLFMFKPASLSHGKVKAKHECHCALRLKILVKNVKNRHTSFKSLFNLETLLGFDVKVQHLIKKTRIWNKTKHCICVNDLKSILQSPIFHKISSEFEKPLKCQ